MKMLNKGFTLLELVITMGVAIMLALMLLGGVINMNKLQNDGKIFRAVYTGFSEGMGKAQKIIFEEGFSMSGTFNTVTDTGSILSVFREDSNGIEKEYFLILDNNCTTLANNKGLQLILTDGVNENIKLNTCVYIPSGIHVSQELKIINENLNEKILNYIIYIDNSTGFKTSLKQTFFVKVDK